MAIKNITGMRFGRLVAINPTEKRSDDGVVFWLCQCDCGNEIIVDGSMLRRGSTKSCGCLRKDASKEAAAKMGRANRKHFGCIYCSSDKHYAKGYCKSCYSKLRKGTLE